MSDAPLQLVTKGRPVPEASSDELQRLVDDTRSGRVTSFVFVAVGPDLLQWHNGYFATSMDRLTLMGALRVVDAECVKNYMDAQESNEL